MGSNCCGRTARDYAHDHLERPGPSADECRDRDTPVVGKEADPLLGPPETPRMTVRVAVLLGLALVLLTSCTYYTARRAGRHGGALDRAVWPGDDRARRVGVGARATRGTAPG
ncbi:hypothetical protein GCM10023201_52110 [Actinomycetospora corticicola]